MRWHCKVCDHYNDEIEPICEVCDTPPAPEVIEDGKRRKRKERVDRLRTRFSEGILDKVKITLIIAFLISLVIVVGAIIEKIIVGELDDLWMSLTIFFNHIITNISEALIHCPVVVAHHISFNSFRIFFENASITGSFISSNGRVLFQTTLTDMSSKILNKISLIGLMIHWLAVIIKVSLSYLSGIVRVIISIIVSRFI